MKALARFWWRLVRAGSEIAFHEAAHWALVADRRLKDLEGDRP